MSQEETPDFLEIQAYVDGELSADRADAMAKLITRSPTLAVQITELRQLKSDVARAFANLPTGESQYSSPNLTAPDPEYAELATPQLEKVDSMIQTNPGLPVYSTRELRFASAGVLAGIAATALVFWSLFRLPAPTQDWVTQVASYHDMYTQQTLSGIPSADPATGDANGVFEEILEQRVKIPNLGNAGYDFKRGQILQSYNAPVVQFAYLGSSNQTPVAFCIRRAVFDDASATSPPTQSSATPKLTEGSAHGVNYVSWSSEQLDFVLAGKLPHAELINLAAIARVDGA